jgi:hypothetical protein
MGFCNNKKEFLMYVNKFNIHQAEVYTISDLLYAECNTIFVRQKPVKF